MNQIQRNTITMLEDALATATHNPPASPPADFPVILGDLTDAITQAKAAAVTQDVDRGTSRTALQTARSVLFTEYLIPIHDIAVGRLTAVPNVRQLFRTPDRTVHRATLIKEATIIATNAAPYKDTFIASGLPADFIDQLDAAITSLSQVSDTHVNMRSDQQKATQTLDATLKQGKQLVQGLNGIMQRAFAKSPEVLTVWNAARRIRTVAPNAGPVAAAPATTALPSTPATTSSTTAAIAEPTSNVGQSSATTTATESPAATPVLHAA